MAEKTNHRYLLVKSTLPEAKGVLMGRYIHNGTADTAAAAEKMSDRVNLDVPASLLLLDCFGAGVTNLMKENPTRIDLGDIVLEPAIAGSVPTLDSPLGEDNKIYLAIRLGDRLRNCLSSIRPLRVSTEELDIVLNHVGDIDLIMSMRRTIIGTHPFCLLGAGLSVNGEGEEVTVVSDVDGTSVRAVYDSDEGTGQRITMHLPAALPAGSAKVVVKSRGFHAGVDETPVSLDPFNVTILPGETPPGPVTPAPTLTAGHTDGHENNPGVMFTDGGFVLTGTNLRNCTWQLGWISKTDEQSHTVTLAGEDVIADSDTQATIIPAALSEAVTDTVMGATIVVTATNAGGSATFNAESAGE